MGRSIRMPSLLGRTALALFAMGCSAPPAERAARTATAQGELGAAGGDLGTNIDFVLGAGHLMY